MDESIRPRPCELLKYQPKMARPMMKVISKNQAVSMKMRAYDQRTKPGFADLDQNSELQSNYRQTNFQYDTMLTEIGPHKHYEKNVLTPREQHTVFSEPGSPQSCYDKIPKNISLNDILTSRIAFELQNYDTSSFKLNSRNDKMVASNSDCNLFSPSHR